MAIRTKLITPFNTGVDDLELYFGRPVKWHTAHQQLKAFAEQYPQFVRYDEEGGAIYFEFDTGEAIIVNYDYVGDQLTFNAVFKSYNPEMLLKQSGYHHTIELALAMLKTDVRKYFGK